MTTPATTKKSPILQMAGAIKLTFLFALTHLVLYGIIRNCDAQEPAKDTQDDLAAQYVDGLLRQGKFQTAAVAAEVAYARAVRQFPVGDWRIDRAKRGVSCARTLATLPPKKQDMAREMFQLKSRFFQLLGDDRNIEAVGVGDDAMAYCAALLGEENQVFMDMSITLMLVHARRLGQWNAADAHYKKVIVTGAKVYGSAEPELANTWADCAQYLHDREQWDSALVLYRKAIDILRASAPKSFVLANCLSCCGEVYVRQGRFEASFAAYDESLSLLVKEHQLRRRDIAITMINCARAHLDANDSRGAIKSATEALRLAETTEDKDLRAVCHILLGNAKLLDGELRGAANEFDSASPLITDSEDGVWSKQRLLKGKATLFALQGRFLDAARLMQTVCEQEILLRSAD